MFSIFFFAIVVAQTCITFVALVPFLALNLIKKLFVHGIAHVVSCLFSVPIVNGRFGASTNNLLQISSVREHFSKINDNSVSLIVFEPCLCMWFSRIKWSTVRKIYIIYQTYIPCHNLSCIENCKTHYPNNQTSTEYILCLPLAPCHFISLFISLCSTVRCVSTDQAEEEDSAS